MGIFGDMINYIIDMRGAPQCFHIIDASIIVGVKN